MTYGVSRDLPLDGFWVLFCNNYNNSVFVSRHFPKLNMRQRWTMSTPTALIQATAPEMLAELLLQNWRRDAAQRMVMLRCSTTTNGIGKKKLRHRIPASIVGGLMYIWWLPSFWSNSQKPGTEAWAINIDDTVSSALRHAPKLQPQTLQPTRSSFPSPETQLLKFLATRAMPCFRVTWSSANI